MKKRIAKKIVLNAFNGRRSVYKGHRHRLALRLVGVGNYIKMMNVFSLRRSMRKHLFFNRRGQQIALRWMNIVRDVVALGAKYD